MPSLRDILVSWKQDTLLKRVVRHSSYLFGSNVAASALSFIQTIVAVRLIGVANWGLVAAIQTFASNINRFLSFRMSEVVVKHLAASLAEDKKREAAALVKAAGLTEAATSVIAFLALALLAPWASRTFANDITAARLFVFYGFILLSNLVYETSTGVLQATHRFDQLGRVALVNSLITFTVISGTYVLYRWSGLVAASQLVTAILLAYILGKTYMGISQFLLAARELNRLLGPGWWKAPLRLLPGKRSLFLFALNTNLNGTVNLFFRDNIPLYLASLLSTTAVGYFKIAMTLTIPITLILDPFIAPTYAEISRTVANAEWSVTRRLLKRVTAIAAGVVLTIWTAWALTGWWVIPFLYKAQARPVYPLLLILVAGYGFAGIFQWNRSLFLSLGKAGYPVLVATLTGLVELALIFLLVPRCGYLMMAALLSGYFVISIGWIAWRGWREVQRREQGGPPSVAAAAPPEETPKAPRAGQRQRRRFLLAGLNRWDGAAVLVFLAFSVVYFLGRLQGNYPLVILGGDAGNIASYAAALDHPDWFKADAILGDLSNVGVYTTVHIPLIRLLNRLTGGYGLAYAWLVLPQTFLQLLGFYWLGRVLFRNRFWAFLLAFLTAMTVINIGLGEIWGVWQEALPRVTFQSLLPFLLALTLAWRGSPRLWPWLMVLAGLLVYVHPISAPAWGLAIWLSLWLVLPRDWGSRKKALVMLALGILFLAVLTPYAIRYLAYRRGDQAVDYTTVMTILQTYSPANLLNAPAALGAFLWNMTRNLLLPVAVIGGAATWRMKKEDRIPLKMVLSWLAGLFIASVLVPFTERLIEQHFRLLPLETELVRCIRYFVPLLLLFWLWPLATWASQPPRPQARRAAVALGLLLVGFWGALNRPAVRDLWQTALCFTQGRLVCSSPRPLDELILTLRTQTQPGEEVLVFNEDTAYISQSLSVRYAALRPLVYSPRDSGTLGYANRAALPAWLETTRQVEALRALPDPRKRLEGLIPLAKSLGARYLVVDFAIPPQVLSGLPVTVILQNEGYLLLQLP